MTTRRNAGRSGFRPAGFALVGRAGGPALGAQRGTPGGSGDGARARPAPAGRRPQGTQEPGGTARTVRGQRLVPETGGAIDRPVMLTLAGYIATIGRVTRRAETIELAVLGLLHEGPMHGYELRKRLNLMLGWGRVLSYGSLYPALKRMLRAGSSRRPPRRRPRCTRRPRTSTRSPRPAPGVRAADLRGRPDRVGGRQLRHPVRVLLPHRHGDPAARPRGTPYPPPGAARPRPVPAGAGAAKSTATPPSSGATASSRWSARSGGSPT